MNESYPQNSNQSEINKELPINHWQAILIVVISIAFVVIIAAIIKISFDLIFGKSNWNSPFLVTELFIVVPTILIINKYRFPLKKAFRFNPVSVSIIIWSIILGFSVTIIGDQLDRIVQKFFPMPEEILLLMEEIFLTPNIIDFVFLLLIGTLGAGFCEEMLFRGFLQRILEKKFRIVAALIIPAILFGLIHANPWLVFQITLLGIALGLLAWRTNSIYPTILVHTLNNLIAICYIRFRSPELESLIDAEQFVNPIILLIAISIFIFSGYQIWISTKPNRTLESR